MSDGPLSRIPRPLVSRATDTRDRDLRAPDQQTERHAAEDGASADPLAELARLIGQSDPFDPAPSRSAATEHSQREWPRAAQSAPRFPFRPAPGDPAAAPAVELADHGGHPGDDHHHESAAYAQYDHAADNAAGHDAEADHAGEGEYAEEYAEADGYEHGEYAYETEPEEHDDAAAQKRRNGAKLAIAVLGLAVFGTAAAFGYRAVFKGGVTGPPPVIHADAAATKVFPADPNAKPISERLSGGGTERVVRRDEDPVELRDPVRGTSTGAIVPGTGAPAPVAPALAPPTAFAPQSTSPPQPVLTEPKRVRTVTIRADQPNAPVDRGTAPAAAPRTASAQTPRPAASNAPLPLNPQAVATAEPPPAAVRQPAPPPRGAESSGSSYVVQISAQKSEAEAQASLRAAQAKYSALSGQPPLIRRKDQGDRGIFYAAQVGPFGSRDEAAQLCESLKSAGGNCFVAKN